LKSGWQLHPKKRAILFMDQPAQKFAQITIFNSCVQFKKTAKRCFVVMQKAITALIATFQTQQFGK